MVKNKANSTHQCNIQSNPDHCQAVAAVPHKSHRDVHTSDETQGPLRDFLNSCLEATSVSIHPFAAECRAVLDPTTAAPIEQLWTSVWTARGKQENVFCEQPSNFSNESLALPVITVN